MEAINLTQSSDLSLCGVTPDSLGMPSSPLLPAYLKLLIERARHCRDDFSVARQPPDLLALLNQGFVGLRVKKVAVFLLIKFL